MNNYYIIILNWNGWSDTENCIKSILQNTNSNNYKIILVDNGSQQDEVNLIENYCYNNFNVVISENKDFFLAPKFDFPLDYEETDSKDKIILIKNNENLGFANGNNVALKFLQNIKAQFALLLNNDTEIGEDALDKMFNFLISHYDSNIAAVVPQIRYFKPKDIIWNCGGNINWLGIRKYFYPNQNIKNVPQKGHMRIDYGTGCALLLDLNKTGVLCDKFFFGEEDMELAFRLKKLNLSTYCLFDSVVFHKVGSSREKISEEKMGNMVFHYSMRMSDLKSHLSKPVWYLSFFAHYCSSIRILYSEEFFAFHKINSMWKDIYSNTKNIDYYKREDFLRISNKKY